jgi:pyruvate/2-oxoglutarate dehydrogenase complex dihydrolipoamide dehydrogenase (E3) component
MGDNAHYASLCVNAGCMPSKALFEPIEAMHHAKPHRHVARITRDHSGAFIIETEVAESMAPIVCEKILLATGRRPTVDQLGLEAAGVELNAGGRLEIDESMRVKGSRISLALKSEFILRPLSTKQKGHLVSLPDALRESRRSRIERLP